MRKVTFWDSLKKNTDLRMIVRGQSPTLLPSSYVTVIDRNDNQRLEKKGLKKSVNFLHYNMLNKYIIIVIDWLEFDETFEHL